jgi:hypothetical protein
MSQVPLHCHPLTPTPITLEIVQIACVCVCVCVCVGKIRIAEGIYREATTYQKQIMLCPVPPPRENHFMERNKLHCLSIDQTWWSSPPWQPSVVHRFHLQAYRSLCLIDLEAIASHHYLLHYCRCPVNYHDGSVGSWSSREEC